MTVTLLPMLMACLLAPPRGAGHSTRGRRRSEGVIPITSNIRKEHTRQKSHLDVPHPAVRHRPIEVLAPGVLEVVERPGQRGIDVLATPVEAELSVERRLGVEDRRPLVVEMDVRVAEPVDGLESTVGLELACLGQGLPPDAARDALGLGRLVAERLPERRPVVVQVLLGGAGDGVATFVGRVVDEVVVGRVQARERDRKSGGAVLAANFFTLARTMNSSRVSSGATCSAAARIVSGEWVPRKLLTSGKPGRSKFPVTS